MTVFIATIRPLPEPDHDEPLLLEALAKAGVDARLVGWRDKKADWASADLVVVRSTWDYFVDRENFVRWAEAVDQVTTLLNPAEVIRWNTHKEYLVDLAHQGLAVTPTQLLRRGDSASLAELMADAGWDTVVIKPAVSAGSYLTMKVGADNREAGQKHLDRMLSARDVLFQRYLSSVEGYGERALVWIDGALRHAVRKTPRFLGDAESVSEAQEISPAEAELAEATLNALPNNQRDTLLYARIDVAPGPDGTPMLMEVELVEPSLFLKQNPAALAAMVEGIRRRI